MEDRDPALATEERDPALVARVAGRPFAGYARRGISVRPSALERIAACVALVLTMVVSGVLLGSSPKAIQRR